MRVVIGTGGTAGHIYPALSVARVLRDRLQADVLFVGRAEGQEARLVPQAGFPLEPVAALPFRRRLSVDTVRAPVAALRAARASRRVVRGADAVLGMGGYVSVPVSLAARRERVPLVVHEQNAAPGLANRVAARWARAVALSFAEAARRFPRRCRTEVTGNPVREAVVRAREDRAALAEEGLRVLELEEGRRTIAVYGGSQGALRLDQAAVRLSTILRDRSDLQVLVITGLAHHQAVRDHLPAVGRLVVRTAAFVDRMELVHAVADVAVARAGAGTIAELSVCGVPSILVPYPYATGRHQEANARALQRLGGARMIPDDEATGDRLAEVLGELLEDPRSLEDMAAAARAFGRPDAADALAELTVSVAKEGRR
ncbi:MAG: undecaprenyldiphospho-muramoylpentapeptide beta-N-acetylglucosaminyltransferase [Actinomycetota bacterium]